MRATKEREKEFDSLADAVSDENGATGDGFLGRAGDVGRG